MTGILLRVLVYVAIALIVWFGVRRIWRDWTGHFKSVEGEERKRRRERDLRERQRPDVIELERDLDGTFRPAESRDDPDRR